MPRSQVRRLDRHEKLPSALAARTQVSCTTSSAWRPERPRRRSTRRYIAGVWRWKSAPNAAWSRSARKAATSDLSSRVVRWPPTVDEWRASGRGLHEQLHRQQSAGRDPPSGGDSPRPGPRRCRPPCNPSPVPGHSLDDDAPNMASEATDEPNSSSFSCDRLVLRFGGGPAPCSRLRGSLDGAPHRQHDAAGRPDSAGPRRGSSRQRGSGGVYPGCHGLCQGTRRHERIYLHRRTASCGLDRADVLRRRG